MGRSIKEQGNEIRDETFSSKLGRLVSSWEKVGSELRSQVSNVVIRPVLKYFKFKPETINQKLKCLIQSRDSL